MKIQMNNLYSPNILFHVLNFAMIIVTVLLTLGTLIQEFARSNTHLIIRLIAILIIMMNVIKYRVSKRKCFYISRKFKKKFCEGYTNDLTIKDILINNEYCFEVSIQTIEGYMSETSNRDCVTCNLNCRIR